MQQDSVYTEGGFLLTLFSQIIDKLPLLPHFDQPQPQLCPRSGPVPAHLIISSTRSRWCLQDLDFCTKNTNLEATPGNKTHPGQTQTNLILDPLLYSYPISFSFCFPILSLLPHCLFPFSRMESACSEIREETSTAFRPLEPFKPSALSSLGSKITSVSVQVWGNH